MFWAAYLDGAVSDVVREHEPAGVGHERLLHERLRTALGRRSSLQVADGEGRLEDHGRGWTRAPGGIDVLAETQAGRRRTALGVEVKIRKLDELLWDAVKIAQRRGEQCWPHALAAAALVVELRASDLSNSLSVSWFDTATAEVDVNRAIRRWPKAWYDLMCGGRGIRPTSLPNRIRLEAGGRRSYADGTLLCWRLLEADHVDAPDRTPVDAHGFPHNLRYPDEWRRQIERAAEGRHADTQVASRHRRTLDAPALTTSAVIECDDIGRLWADVWDTGFQVPTSFRLTSDRDLRYDARVANNGALHMPDPPKPLPEWCRGAVQLALERRRS